MTDYVGLFEVVGGPYDGKRLPAPAECLWMNSVMCIEPPSFGADRKIASNWHTIDRPIRWIERPAMSNGADS